MIRTARLALALALAATLVLAASAAARPAADHPLAFAAEDGDGECPDVPVEESAGCEDPGAADSQDGGDEESWDLCDPELDADCAADDEDDDDGADAVEPTLPATVKVARRPVKVTHRTITLTATCQQDEGCVAATYTLKLKAGKRLTRKAKGKALSSGERARLTFRLTRAQVAKLARRTVKATVSAPGAHTVSLKLHA
jgi:hypothetical protein